MNIRSREWITPDRKMTVWDLCFNMTDKPKGFLVEFENGTVAIVGEINLGGGTCGCCEDNGYIKRYSALEIE